MVRLFGGGKGGAWWQQKTSAKFPPPLQIQSISCYTHMHMYMHVPNQHLHVCTDHHSSMLNATARLAIRIRYLPDFPFEWTDTNPQSSRQTLTIDDFLPSSEDAMKLQQSAAQYLMSFLVENFTDLTDLQCYVPPMESIHPPQKSEVIPMKILFKDEKLKVTRLTY